MRQIQKQKCSKNQQKNPKLNKLQKETKPQAGCKFKTSDFGAVKYITKRKCYLSN